MNAELIAAVVHLERQQPEALSAALAERDPFARRRLIDGLLSPDLLPALSAWGESLSKAETKWEHLVRPFFTSRSLEQGSGSAVARWRAAEITRRLDRARPWLDVGCGAGSDLSAWCSRIDPRAEEGRAATEVRALEPDPVLAACAQANLDRRRDPEPQRSARVISRRLEEDEEADAEAFVFADPDRRDEAGARAARRLVDARPGPEALLRIARSCGGRLAVKAAPALQELGALEPLEPEWQWVAVRGEVKECLLWCGPLRRHARSAVALPAGVEVPSIDDPHPESAELRAGRLIALPTRVVRASDLREALAVQMGAALVPDSRDLLVLEEGHAGHEALAPHGLAVPYELQEILPTTRAPLLRRLRALRDADGVIVKRLRARTHGRDADRLLRDLSKRPGSPHEASYLLDTTLAGRAAMLLLRPLPTDEPSSTPLDPKDPA